MRSTKVFLFLFGTFVPFPIRQKKRKLDSCPNLF